MFSFCWISDSENDVSEPMAKTSFPIDFTKLFHALNQATHTEEGTLLLYTLLHRNEAFKSFVLASSDVDLLGWDFVKKLPLNSLRFSLMRETDKKSWSIFQKFNY